MILDLPYRLADRTAPPGGGGRPQSSGQGRVTVAIRELDEREAPVAVRWRPPGAAWRWTRAVGTAHHAPVRSAPGREGAAAAAMAILLGEPAADGAEGQPAREGLDGPLEAETRILARATSLLVVGNVLHALCHEPILCETSPGGDVVVQMSPVLDWSMAYPMASAPSLLGRLAHEVDLRSPSSFSVDSEHVLRRVIRKSLILARSGGVASAAPWVERTVRDLESGAVADAARSMGGCLALIARSPAASARLRDFSTRTSVYLLGMATELAA